MKLTSSRLAVLAIFVALICSNCKDESSPTEPLEGTWSLSSGYVESHTEIHSNNVTTDVFPCFYDGVADTAFTNELTLSDNQTGNFSWNIRCTPSESYSFTWQLSGDNEITIDHVSGETWVWSITSLSNEVMEVEFSRERDIELPTSGAATQHESISLQFTKGG